MTSKKQRVFRFAPSPNGYLHLGHAYSALLNFDLARDCGGRFLLRIEDIDRGRARPEFEAAIYEDLAWLGLDWERPVRRQCEHFGAYARALERLDEMGLIYACDCKRSDIARATAAQAHWPRDPDGSPLYPGTCRTKPRRPAREVLAKGGVALRLDMRLASTLAGRGLTWREFGDVSPSLRGGVVDEAIQARTHSSGLLRCARNDGEGTAIAADPAQWGDVVLARKDTPASYHIAVVVDDALQGVTDVVRGKDLFEATSLHRLLQHLLGLSAPNYLHHDLIMDEKGEKLAKSVASTALRALRTRGWTPADVRRRIGL
ncbi:tRNA glutamyl-Q(34) synthetase GluQRS [Methylocystis sp. B8]|uniref:tRNA glutamyl-Q(34) synthetase GluQRS n=1 Tax=Methylocystis sp. B8 TaxID=544938 RepID=UPI0010FE9117|nr:tRNA glutamyl-Q(34) synthetase GluQRS [Methylocystis sp. B8]TLG79230.1 tRNA glutamyl-Q(34) synthetase GluQRS [Methylocystis sp. B8]